MKKQKFEIKRQERETNQALIRRFTKRLKDSGILINAKKSQFRKRPKSLQMRKKAVLRKIERKLEFEKQRKLGRV
jgi:transcription initiation factor IIE alpha subunit